MEAVQAYRQLLKAVDKHISKEGTKRHFRDFIVEAFKKNVKLADQKTIQQNIRTAKDYTLMLNSVQHHKDLLLSYNIAVDRSDELKRTITKSAASVGLKLPEVYQA